MIRIGSVGYGDIAQRSHFPQLRKLGSRARLEAVCGRNRRSLEDVSGKLGIPQAYTDLDEMLARDDIDAVLVLTPPSVHADVAVKAIEAGKHVLIEKPMVRTMAEARRILAAAEKQDVVVFPLPYVASPMYDALRRLLDDGAVGEVTNVECHKSHRGPTHAGWFYDKEIAGGGVLFDLGIYALGGIVYTFGPAERVGALCTTRYSIRTLDDGSDVHPNVEDSALLNLWLERGIAVNVNANWNGYLSHHHTRSRMTVFGREGMVHFGVPGGGMYLHRDDGEYGMVGFPSTVTDFDGYSCRKVDPGAGAARGIVEHFVDLVESGDASTRLLEQQVHVMEIMLAAYDCGGPGDAYALKTRC